jgi:hypothetical protein
MGALDTAIPHAAISSLNVQKRSEFENCEHEYQANDQAVLQQTA